MNSSTNPANRNLPMLLYSHNNPSSIGETKFSITIALCDNVRLKCFYVFNVLFISFPIILINILIIGYANMYNMICCHRSTNASIFKSKQILRKQFICDRLCDIWWRNLRVVLMTGKPKCIMLPYTGEAHLFILNLNVNVNVFSKYHTWFT